MKKIVASWMPFLFWQAVLSGALYCWKVHGVDAGRNVLLLVSWMAAIVGIGVALITPTKPITPRGSALRAAGRTATVAWLLVFAALGQFSLAIAYVLGAAGNKVYLDKFDVDGNPLPADQPGAGSDLP